MKGLTTTLLALVLFQLFDLYRVMLTLNNTVFNTDFVNEQLDKLDITAVTNETISQELDEENTPRKSQGYHP